MCRSSCASEVMFSSYGSRAWYTYLPGLILTASTHSRRRTGHAADSAPGWSETNGSADNYGLDVLLLDTPKCG